MRTRYARDPIVEAVLEARLAGATWTDEVSARVMDRLRADYPGAPRYSKHYQFDLSPEVDDGPHLMTGKLALRSTLLPSADGTQLVGVSPGVLTLHVLAPYPGWADFLGRFQRAFEVYVHETRAQGVGQIGVRYIDQIVLPPDAERRLSDYFPCLPARPAAMPEQLDGFQVTIQTTDPLLDFTSTLAMATMPKDEQGRPVVLYDLNLVRLFGRAPASFGELGPHFDFLHQKQRDIFEDSITEQTRGLFS